MDEAMREHYSVMAGETNRLMGPELHGKVDHGVTVALADEQLIRIIRLRLVGYHRRDFPWWDVSYCYGELNDGSYVRVNLGEWQLRPRYKSHLVELCKAAGRHGKSMGLFDAISTLPG